MNLPPLSRFSIRWRLAAVLAVAVVMTALVMAHVRGLNGPWYWMWAWHRLGWSIYPIALAAAVPFFLGQWVYARSTIRRKTIVALLLVMASSLAMQLAILCVQPLGFHRIAAIVQNSVNTSYYSAAKVLTEQMDRGASYRDWLEIYPQLMPNLMLHAGYKPPGLILYYILIIRIFGEGYVAATAGGLIIGVLAAGGVAGTYALLRQFKLSEDQAFYGASYFALTPSLVGFLPQADQAYALLGCIFLMLWLGAMRRGSWWLAIAFGVMLTMLVIISPTFLVFGGFLGIYTLLHIRDRAGRGFFRALQLSALALATVFASFALIWLIWRFDMIETMRVAEFRAVAYMVKLERPWPLHSLFDVIDIALGTGWMSFPLAAMGLIAIWRMSGAEKGHDSPRTLVTLGVFEVLLTVVVAVFPGENARLMIPLMPLLMAPIGIELSRWNFWARMAVYLLLVIVAAVIWQNMVAIYMGEEIEGVPRV